MTSQSLGWVMSRLLRFASMISASVLIILVGTVSPSVAAIVLFILTVVLVVWSTSGIWRNSASS